MSKRLRAATERLKEMREEYDPLTSLNHDPCLNVYFYLKHGCANEKEQEEAADIVAKFNRILNMLVEANAFKESIEYDDSIKKYRYRGNVYTDLIGCIANEVRKEFKPKPSLLDQVIAATPDWR